MSVVTGAFSFFAPDPKSDFFAYVNREFLEKEKIPPDRTSCSTWDKISDACDAEILIAIKESVPEIWRCSETSSDADPPTALQKLVLLADRAAAGEARALGELHAYGVNALFSAHVDPSVRLGDDAYVLKLGQGGISLPTGSYYRSHKDPYTKHIGRMLLRMRSKEPATSAFRTEECVCFREMSPADSQDAAKTNNIVAFGSLPPNFNWAEYAAGLGCAETPREVNVECVKSLEKAAELFASKEIRAYLHWRCVDMIASSMGPSWQAAQFEFYGKKLLKKQKDRSREKHMAETICALIPSTVGLAYVERRRPDHVANRERAREIVKSVAAALRDTFEESKVLTADVRHAWELKIDNLGYMVGFPDTFPAEELGVALIATKLAADTKTTWAEVVIGAIRESTRVSIARIGARPDPQLWSDTMPHTVNACFVPELNKIVVPAAILQPPIFDASKSDAYNYGSLGAIIGHELSHAFDPNGMRFEEHGKLVRVNTDWYNPLKSRIDAQAKFRGENASLTSAENVADIAGLRVAHIAMRRRTHRADIGDDRAFFSQWARVWAAKLTKEDAAERHLIDPHGSSRFRCNNAVAHVDAFYDAFGVKRGHAMYLPLSERSCIWLDPSV